MWFPSCCESGTSFNEHLGPVADEIPLHEFRQKKASTWFRISAMNNSIFYLKFFHVPSFQIPRFRKMTIFQATKRRTRKPNSFRPLGNPLHLALVPWYLPVDLPPGGTCRESLEETNGKLPSELSTSQPWHRTVSGWDLCGHRVLRFPNPEVKASEKNRNSSGWILQPQKLRGFLFFGKGR